MSDPEVFDHYLYALQFDNGVVKVGRTKHKAQRIRSLRTRERKDGVEATKGWTSDPHSYTDVVRGEAALIGLCSRRFPVAKGAEYFRADLLDVIELAAEVNQALLLLSQRFDLLVCDVFAA